MSESSRTVVFSLVSHTNVGKTTLARTLLRRDVGEVLDQPHVTLENERFVLLETPAGDRLEIWDTPGFGDSVRLLRRLEQHDRPVRWMLTQAWDRLRNRPLWCGQQAMKNVREEADLVLYLVNASEDPELAAYLEPELRILDWSGKPVVVLLNQTGAARLPQARQADEVRWRTALVPYELVRAIVSLDAFSRCWVQEGVLFRLAADVLEREKGALMRAVLDAWTRRSRETWTAAMSNVAALLATAAADREVPGDGWVTFFERDRAIGRLQERYKAALDDTVEALIEAHGLRGRVAEDFRARIEDVSAPDEPPNPWTVGVLGGVVSGALGGLAADVASGGLTFGGGVVMGALLGGAGLGGLTWGYQAVAGGENLIRWSDDFLDRQLREMVLRYLAVAHFGRGSGDFRDRGQPAFWRAAVDEAIESRRDVLGRSWKRAREQGDGVRGDLSVHLEELVSDVLLRFYPEAASLLAHR